MGKRNCCRSGVLQAPWYLSEGGFQIKDRMKAVFYFGTGLMGLDNHLGEEGVELLLVRGFEEGEVVVHHLLVAAFGGACLRVVGREMVDFLRCLVNEG